MKKKLALLLACSMALSLTACGGGSKPAETTAAPETTTAAASEAAKEESKEDAAETTAAEAAGGDMDALIEAAKAEGELTVYGSCEEEYLSAACQNFEKLYGIKTKYQRLSTSEVYTKISEEAGKPSADVWFGGTTDPYNEAVADGLLMEYNAINAKNLIGDQYKDPTNCWYGIYKGILGFMVNTEELDRLGLEAPKTWEDLADPKYKGEIIMASPAISGTQYAILNGTIQAYGEEKGWEVWKGINENVDFYAQGGGEPGPKCAAGEFGIAVLAMTGGTFAMEAEYPVTAVYPEDMIPWTPAPIAIFKNSQNKDAAKVFVDYFLSKEGQEALREADARIMARGDVAIPEAIGTVDTEKLIDQDVLLFGSQREALLEKWAAMVGEKDAK